VGRTGSLMGKERRVGPVEGLRNLALALERLAAREAASGAVRGAADGLREELPELDGQLRSLLTDALTVLGRLVHEAAESEHQAPGEAAHAMAGAATRGALEVLEREWQDGGLPLHGFVERFNRLLDEVLEFTHSRTDEIRAPMERAEALSRGMVKAAVEQLHESGPALAEDARKWGRGLVEGLREELASHPASGEALAASVEALVERSSAAAVRGAAGALAGYVRPFMAAVGAGGALLLLSLVAVRWRAS
jgi:hypothetical protein